MATVPGVPEARTTAQGALQPLDVRANSEAFGAGLAAGGEQLAAGAQQASDTEFAVAKFQKALTNKADADQGSIAFDTQANGIRVDYLTNVRGGAATQEALKAASDKVDQLRQDSGANLNPMARQLYDDDSRRTAFNVISQLAAHTATEQNAYVKQSMTSLIDLKRNNFASDPTNPIARQDFLDTVDKQFKVFQQMEGWDDNTTALAAQKATSKGFLDAIESVSVEDPIRAQEMKDEAAKNQWLTGDDNRVLDKYLHAVTKPYVGNRLVDDLFTGGDAGKPSLEAIRANPQAYFDAHVGDGVTVTSAQRTPAENAAVKGVADSNHIPNRAWDLVPGDAKISMAELYAKSKAIPGADEVLLEKGNQQVSDPALADHVHVGFKSEGPKGKPLAFQTVEQIDEAWAPLQRKLEAQVDAQFGGDPELKQYAIRTLDSRLGAIRTGLNAQAQASAARIQNSILPDGSGATLPTTAEELFKAYPGSQNDFLNLTTSERAGVLRQLNHNAHPTFGDLTPEQLNGYQELDGLSRSNPAAFADLKLLGDPRSAGLPNATIAALMKKQNEIRGGQPSNSTERGAMTVVAPFIDSAAEAGFFPAGDNGKALKTSPDYLRFTSQYLGLIRDYEDINKRPPDLQHQQQIAVTAMAQFRQGAPSISFVPGVPEDFVKAYQSAARVRGTAVTPDQIRTKFNEMKAAGRVK